MIYGQRCTGDKWLSELDIWSEMYRSTESVDIDDGNMVIYAQALRKCGYPRWIYGQRCTAVKEVWISKVDIW